MVKVVFNTPRPKKLTTRKYFNQRLLDKDGRFAHDLDSIFTAQYTIESKQIFDDANNYIWRQKPSRTFTASLARNPDVIRQFVRKDEAYSFLKNERGSPPYYQRTFLDLLAMIRQLGTLLVFFLQCQLLISNGQKGWVGRVPMGEKSFLTYQINFFEFSCSHLTPISVLGGFITPADRLMLSLGIAHFFVLVSLLNPLFRLIL